MAFSGGAAQHNGLTPREVLISGDYNGNSVPVAVTSAGVLQVSGGNSGDADITGGGAQSAVAVGTSSVAIAASDSDRTRLWLKNDGPNTCYLNHSASAAVATGFPLLSGERMLMEGAEAKLAWNGICTTAESASIRRLTGTVA